VGQFSAEHNKKAPASRTLRERPVSHRRQSALRLLKQASFAPNNLGVPRSVSCGSRGSKQVVTEAVHVRSHLKNTDTVIKTNKMKE
jgi:hypothetical protein